MNQGGEYAIKLGIAGGFSPRVRKGCGRQSLAGPSRRCMRVFARPGEYQGGGDLQGKGRSWPRQHVGVGRVCKEIPGPLRKLYEALSDKEKKAVFAVRRIKEGRC